MDLHTQAAILKAIEQHGKANIIVLLGSPSPESAAIAATTVVNGDPTYAGPLAGVQLGLAVFHILEDQVCDAVDPRVYEEQVGIMDTVLDTAGIVAELAKVRA